MADENGISFDDAIKLNTPAAPGGQGGISFDQARAAGGGGAAPRGPTRIYSPNPDAPQIAGGEEGAYKGGEVKPYAKPSGVFANYTARIEEGLRDSAAWLLGTPAQAASGPFTGGNAISPSFSESPLQHWRSLPDEEKKKFRENNPIQGSFADFLDKAESNPVLGRKFFRDVIQYAGSKTSQAVGLPGADPSTVQPTNREERIAGSAGRMTSEMVAMGVGGGALAKEWKEGEALLGEIGKPIAEMMAGTSLRSNAAMGTASGAAGETVVDMVPDRYKPAARMAAETVAGFPVVGVGHMADKAIQSGRRAFETSEASAARKILEHTEDPEAFRTKLANETNVGDKPLVEGSEPTTAELTGDLKLAGLQRDLATGDQKHLFDRRAAEQNQARVDALEGLEKNGGDPEKVSDYIIKRVREIESYHDKMVADASAQFHDQVAGVGGQRNYASDYGNATRDKIMAIRQQEKEEMQGFWDSLELDKSVPTNTQSLESSASKIEGGVAESARPMQKEESAIFNVVRGYEGETSFGELIALRSRITDELARAEGQPLRRLAQLLTAVDKTLAYKASTAVPNAAPKLAQEAAAWEGRQGLTGVPGESGVTGGLGETGNASTKSVTYSEPRLNDAASGGLDTIIGEKGGFTFSVRGPGGGEAALYPRFVQEATDKGLHTVVTKEQATVAPVLYASANGITGDGLTFVTRSRARATRMGGGADPIEFRLKEGSTIYPDLGGAGPGFGTRDGRTTLLRDKQSESGGIMRIEDLEPHSAQERGVPEAVAQRYDEAKGATRDFKTIFDEGSVGNITAKGTQDNGFAMTSSNVMNNVVGTPEKLNAFMRAAGKGDPAQQQALRDEVADYLSFSFKGAAVRDGEISPAGYRNWMANHEHVFEQFPELRDKFNSVKKAQDTLDTAVGLKKDQLDDFQNKAVTLALRGEQPRVVVARTLENPVEFGRLVGIAREGGEDAVAGLKRATVEHIVDRAIATKGDDLKLNALGQLYSRMSPSLSKLFSSDELKSIENVIIDANRSAEVKGVSSARLEKVPGPDVPRSLLNTFIRKFGYGVFATTVGGAAAGGYAGHEVVGGALGTGIGMLAAGLATMRIKSTRDALVELMLHPDLAQKWTAKIASEEPPRTFLQSLDRQMRTLAMGEVVDGMARAARGGETPTPKKDDTRRDALYSMTGGYLGSAPTRETNVPRETSFPGQGEVDTARKVDQSYGDRRGTYYDNPDATMRQVSERNTTDVINNKLYDKVPEFKVGEGDKNMADRLYMAHLAANRSAVAGLGFDPRKFVFTPDRKGDGFTEGGRYVPSRDVGWADMKEPSNVVHESLHRGIEMLKQRGALAKTPAEARTSGKPYVDEDVEEKLVRAMMVKNFGDIEMGQGSLGDKQVREGKDALRAIGFVALIDQIEKLAAGEVAKDRPRGPR